jgi:lysophospholipase L1-like esterase
MAFASATLREGILGELRADIIGTNDGGRIGGSVGGPQTQVRTIEQELAVANHAAYVSMAEIEGSEANAEALGLMATDGTHDSDQGGVLWGKVVQTSITVGVFDSQPSTSLNVVFCGDSITFGAGVANGGTILVPTMPYFAIKALGNLPGVAAVYGSNQGHSGHTTTTWLPGKDDYNHARDAMTALIAAHPDAVQIFSFLLGTNDSASNGTDNGPYKSALPVGAFQSNLETITAQLLRDFPKARIIWNDAPYYTPNTHNRATYEQPGLDMLQKYRAATEMAVKHFARKQAGHVFVGDTDSFAYFKDHYLDELKSEKIQSFAEYQHTRVPPIVVPVASLQSGCRVSISRVSSGSGRH